VPVREHAKNALDAVALPPSTTGDHHGLRCRALGGQGGAYPVEHAHPAWVLKAAAQGLVRPVAGARPAPRNNHFGWMTTRQIAPEILAALTRFGPAPVRVTVSSSTSGAAAANAAMHGTQTAAGPGNTWHEADATITPGAAFFGRWPGCVGITARWCMVHGARCPRQRRASHDLGRRLGHGHPHRSCNMARPTLMAVQAFARAKTVPPSWSARTPTFCVSDAARYLMGHCVDRPRTGSPKARQA